MRPYELRLDDRSVTSVSSYQMATASRRTKHQCIDYAGRIVDDTSLESTVTLDKGAD